MLPRGANGLEKFESADRRALELLARKVMKDHWPCPCGSKRALRACHGERLRMLRRRSPQQSWKLLRKAIRDADAIPGPPASPNRV
jgi:hypothetical protein